jgi:hypothetical protein
MLRKESEGEVTQGETGGFDRSGRVLPGEPFELALRRTRKINLIIDGSYQKNIWEADWYPESRNVGFGALINIRPLFLLLHRQPVDCPPSVAIKINAMMHGSVP